MTVYLGSYASANDSGIHVFTLDTTTGALTRTGGVSGVANPSFLAVHPNRRFLYAVGETGNFNGSKGGAVAAFAIDGKNGQLTLLNQESSVGTGPCYVAVDHAGKNALVANYGGGSVACLPIGTDGRLGKATAFVQHQGSSVNKQRQNEPHAHSINVDAQDRFAIAADLGLDKLLVYRFDPAQGTLAPNEPPAGTVAPGAGPRHVAFHPNGRLVFAINEINSTLTAFRFDGERGTLTETQTLSTLPDGFSGNNSTAEIQAHPNGKFVYGSNRGHDSIAVFAIEDASTGRLRLVEHQSTQGKTPRNFGIDPTGNFLLAANQDSDSVVVFRIDPQTGRLAPTGHVVSVPKPVCVKFLPPAP